MNKRGFLLGEETVKIVLSLIAIIFLIFFIVSLYNNYSKNKGLEYAKDSLNHLIDEINSGSSQVEIYNPNEWYLSSFPKHLYYNLPSSGSDLIIPKMCSSVGWKKCICIYKWNKKGIDVSKAVDNTGICRQNDFSVKGVSTTSSNIQGKVMNTIEIKNPPLLLSINQEDKIIQKQ